MKNDPLSGLDPDSKQYKSQANMKRLKFLNRFQMMTAGDKLTSIVTQSLQDSPAFFRCDPEKWPMCIFDFTYKHCVPQYFVYRQKSIEVIDNYFYGGKPIMVEKKERKERDDLMIERGFHLCN